MIKKRMNRLVQEMNPVLACAVVGLFCALTVLPSSAVRAELAPDSAQYKEESQYWKDLRLKFRAVRSFIDPTTCYSSESSLSGCIAGAGSALALLEPPLSVLPGRLVGRRKVVQAFGPISIVQTKSGEGENPIENFKASKKQKDALQAAVHDLFARRRQYRKANFALILDWVGQKAAANPGKESEMTAEAINGFLGAKFDPHTYIIPSEYLKEEESSSSDSFVGIGVNLQQLSKNFVITSPIEGGPALEAGVRAKDLLVRINGEKVTGLTMDALTEKIRGPEGSPVTLGIQRIAGNTPKEERQLDLKVFRRKITIPNVDSQMLKNSGVNVAYVRLSSFMEESACDEVASAVLSLQKKGAKGLILDLRNNGGGLITQAQCITGLFTGPNRTVLTEEYLEGGTETLSTSRRQITWLPMVTLINANSASASEIVSGALQDYGRSLILGERSFGKATVQALEALRGLKGIEMAKTIARFTLPSGRTNQIVGITPDLEVYPVPNPTEEDRIAFREEDSYLNPMHAPVRPLKLAAATLPIRQCVTLDKEARALYDQLKDHPIAPDFQLLSAESALKCQL